MIKKIVSSFILLVLLISLQAQNLDFEGFKIKKQVKSTVVKDQSMSPTCWSFATVSFIESELLRMNIGEFDLSEMYIAYNVYLRKARQHYRMMANNFFTGGGQPHNVMITLKEKGIVPESVYSGLKEDKNSHNHSDLDNLIKKQIGQIVDLKGEKLSATWEQDIVSTLDKQLGSIPDSFKYNSKSYSPKDFAEDVLQIKPDDYIEITSYTHHPFYTSFCLESRYNWEQQLYFNIPLDELVEIIHNSINTGYSVCWNGDVSEDSFDVYKGVAELKVDGEINQLMRQKLFDNHSTTVDHVMHLIGIAENSGKDIHYLIKNSWGTEPNRGYLFMSDAYLKLKTISIMVHKEAIPKKIRKKMGI